MAKNKEIHGIEILDLRGNHTVAASVVLDSGTSGCAATPSGAATGSREAVELRDKAARATQAVANINGELREACSAATRPSRPASTG